MSFPLFHLLIFAGAFYIDGIDGDSEILLERNHTDSSWIWLTRYALSAGSRWTHESSTGEYTVCDLMETKRDNTNSWLVSDFIPVRAARAITVKITFTVRKCDEAAFKFCKENFKLYSFESEELRPGGINRDELLAGNLSIVGLMNSSQTWSRGHQRKNNEVNVTFPVKKPVIYLGFQDTGACIAVKLVRVFYYYCPKIEHNDVTFNRTAALPYGRIKVRGKCSTSSENGFQEKIQFAECLSTGSWAGLQNIGCLCKIGYFRAPNGCQEQPRLNVVYLSSELVLLSWISHEIPKEVEVFTIHCNECEDGSKRQCIFPCNVTVWSTTEGIGNGRATVVGLRPSTIYLFTLTMLSQPVVVSTVHVSTPKGPKNKNTLGNDRNGSTSGKHAVISVSSFVSLTAAGVLFFVAVVLFVLACHLKRRYSAMAAKPVNTETTSQNYENRSAQVLVMDELCVHTSSAMEDAMKYRISDD